MSESPEFREPLPDIKEMQCPIMDKFHRVKECLKDMDRPALAAHISKYHDQYLEDPELYFDAEREKRFGHAASD